MLCVGYTLNFVSASAQFAIIRGHGLLPAISRFDPDIREGTDIIRLLLFRQRTSQPATDELLAMAVSSQQALYRPRALTSDGS